MEEKLIKKEESFCRYFVLLRNGREAAALAGFKLRPRAASQRLLAKSEIQKRIEAIRSEEVNLDEVKAGFRRLAFGSVADAVKLIDGDRNDLESMDLFLVSDIKIPKGGGMEIKFFDRQKALESLMLLENADRSEGTLPFYKALENSAKSLRNDENE